MYLAIKGVEFYEELDAKEKAEVFEDKKGYKAAKTKA